MQSISTNEKRLAMGYEPVDGGDVLLVNSGLIPLEMAGQTYQRCRYYDKKPEAKICKGCFADARPNCIKVSKDIKRELKLTASQLAESYRINQSTVEYPQIQNEHQKRIQ